MLAHRYPPRRKALSLDCCSVCLSHCLMGNSAHLPITHFIWIVLTATKALGKHGKG
ncbi:hypothetical protein BD414DRAFT_198284 [Trametes punicea]|nr:hypothetical protein BD414DRAFT_198284 [Trametes punicea]